MTVMMVSQVYLYLQTHEIVYITYLYLVCQSYLCEVVGEKMIGEPRMPEFCPANHPLHREDPKRDSRNNSSRKYAPLYY